MPFAINATLATLVVLGIMVLVHEFGHFIAAKGFGVRVEVFSIGFPPRLFGFRRGEFRLDLGHHPQEGGHAEHRRRVVGQPPVAAVGEPQPGGAQGGGDDRAGSGR